MEKLDFSRQSWIDPPVWGSLTLDIIGGREADYDQQWGSNGIYLHDDCLRLYCPLKGQAQLDPRGAPSITMHPGMLYLIPPGATVRYRCAGPWRLSWLHLRLEIAPGFDPLHRQQCIRQIPLDDRLHSEWRQAISSIQGCEGIAFRAHAAVLSILSKGLQQSWEHLAPRPDKLHYWQDILQHMADHPENDWNNHGLAALVHLHPTTFANRFSKTLGISPREHLIALRMRKARNLLRHQSDPIHQIAESCGFSDPYYFSRLFRQRSGLTPSAYRKQYQDF